MKLKRTLDKKTEISRTAGGHTDWRDKSSPFTFEVYYKKVKGKPISFGACVHLTWTVIQAPTDYDFNYWDIALQYKNIEQDFVEEGELEEGFILELPEYVLKLTRIRYNTATIARKEKMSSLTKEAFDLIKKLDEQNGEGWSATTDGLAEVIAGFTMQKLINVSEIMIKATRNRSNGFRVWEEKLMTEAGEK